MKACASCGAEYVDAVTTCADCGSDQLQTKAAEPSQAAPAAPLAHDDGPLVLVGVADDPLTAERFEALLTQSGMRVDVREQQGGTVNRLTDGVLPFWQLYVSAHQAAAAAQLLREAQQLMDAQVDEAARAAEEEATASMTH